MAITWQGSAVTGRIAGDVQDYMAIAILSNDRFSSHNINVLRAMVQCDVTSFAGSTTQFVPCLTYRGVGSPITGDTVTTAPKCSFDTQQSSDPLIRLYYPATGDGINNSQLSGTPSSGIVWRQWVCKLRTGVEQQLQFDNNQLPALVQNIPFVLRPGEYLVFRSDPVATSDNNPGFGWFINIVWEEDSIATHTIGGTVKLSSVGVVGAKVTVLVADDALMTNAVLWEVITTTTGGAWTSSAIPDGKYAYAYANNYTAGTYYTATGAPMVS